MDERVKSTLQKIRNTRIEKKITILDLSNITGLSRSFIHYIERGEKVPTLTVLYKLADAMNVDITQFFD